LVGNFDIPKAEAWDFAGNLLAGLLIAGWVALLVQRRAFRSQQWDGKRFETYMAVADQLLKIKSLGERLGAWEAAEDNDQPTLPREHWKPLEDEVWKCHRVVETEFQRGQFLLSRRAIGVLEKYVEGMKSMDNTTHPYSALRTIVRMRYQDFYEVTRVDLDDGSVWLWRIRRRWRMLDHWVYRTRAHWGAKYALWRDARERKGIAKEFKAQHGRMLANNTEAWAVRNFKRDHGRLPTAEELSKLSP
jgi:hypothetical protein